MSLLPFDPTAALSRFVLYATTAHVVSHFDESLQQLNGVSFTSIWISQNLNRQEGDMRKATLRMLRLRYVAAADTTLEVSASGDGGLTWSEVKTVNVLAAGASRNRIVSVPFQTSGDDIRFRIRHLTDVLVTVLAWTPTLTKRGRTSHV